jgi:hypothetical protein
MEENAIHAKYIELVSHPPVVRVHILGSIAFVQFAELKRVERDHAKEKQKLLKDKDAGSPTFEIAVFSYV